MAANVDSDGRSSDVQQHGIDEANTTYDLASGGATDRPKKKRKRLDREERDAADDVDHKNGKVTTKRKKTNKLIEGTADAVAVEEADGRDVAVIDGKAVGGVKGAKKKLGKRRRTEHIESTQQRPGSIEPFLDPQLATPNIQGSTTFISSVATAPSPLSNSQEGSPPLSTPLVDCPGYYPMPPGYPPGVPPALLPHPEAGAFIPNASFNSDGTFANGLNTNEDILRAIQELDLTKLAAVLKAFGDAASVGSVPFNLASCLSPQHAVPYYTGGPNEPSGSQVPAFSSAILGQPPKNPPKFLAATKKRSTAVTMPVLTTNQNPEHAHILATRWMNASKLAEMVKETGLVYKKGKFSTSEEAAIQHAIENYRVNRGLGNEDLHEIIFAKEAKKRDNAFWSEITSQVPQRPIIAVYHHVRRTHHPLKQQGKWLSAEDDVLRATVAELGQSWEKVSARVGRMASDCRDRWRNHIANREARLSGVWSKEEEDLLVEIVTEMTIAQGKDADQDVFWSQVSQRMGNKRGRQQCRIKWTDALSKTVKNDGQKPRWSQQDAYILVHKIASLNVRDDSEIDWKLISDSDWNFWSAHSLQRRWLTLKRGVRGYEDMTHQEIMDILIVKKAHAPPPPPAPRKNRVTSVPVIPYDTLMEEPVLSTGFSESMNIPSDPQAAFQAMNENADPGPSTLPNEAMALDNQAKDGEECVGELLHSSLSSDDSDSG